MNINICKECPHVDALVDETGKNYRIDCSLIYWYKECFGPTLLAKTPDSNFSNRTVQYRNMPSEETPWDTMELAEDFQRPYNCPMEIEHEHTSM